MYSCGPPPAFRGVTIVLLVPSVMLAVGPKRYPATPSPVPGTRGDVENPADACGGVAAATAATSTAARSTNSACFNEIITGLLSAQAVSVRSAVCVGGQTTIRSRGIKA
jgi:hypothetical protein